MSLKQEFIGAVISGYCKILIKTVGEFSYNHKIQIIIYAFVGSFIPYSSYSLTK